LPRRLCFCNLIESSKPLTYINSLGIIVLTKSKPKDKTLLFADRKMAKVQWYINKNI